jgi:hypothetical protein
MSESMINSLKKKLQKKAKTNDSNHLVIRKSISIKPTLPSCSIQEEFLENSNKLKKYKITNEMISNKISDYKTPAKNKNFRSLEKSPRISPEDLYKIKKTPLINQKMLNKFCKYNSIRHDSNLLTKLGLQKLPKLSLEKQKVFIQNSIMNNTMLGSQGFEMNLICNHLENTKFIELHMNNRKNSEMNSSIKNKDESILLSNDILKQKKLNYNKSRKHLDDINKEEKSHFDSNLKYVSKNCSIYDVSYEAKKMKNSIIAANNFSQRTSYSIPTFNTFVRKPNQIVKPKIKILLNKEFIDKLIDHISDSDD